MVSLITHPCRWLCLFDLGLVYCCGMPVLWQLQEYHEFVDGWMSFLRQPGTTSFPFLNLLSWKETLEWLYEASTFSIFIENLRRQPQVQDHIMKLLSQNTNQSLVKKMQNAFLCASFRNGVSERGCIAGSVRVKLTRKTGMFLADTERQVTTCGPRKAGN